MKKNYNLLTSNIKNRLNPDGILLEKSFRNELGSISYSDALTYVRYAMKGVEPEYTQKSKEAGEKVKDHLKKVLDDVVYKYQGSVMTNTHIKGHSDIDLLAISDRFYSWNRRGVSNLLNNPARVSQHSPNSIQKLIKENSRSGGYTNALNDLREIRRKSELKMTEVYSICDTSKPKAIKIKNLSLNREVDIVTANWYDDVTSIINDKSLDYRGIQIYNKHEDKKGDANYPFTSISRINRRSSDTGGRLKKMIRFLKHCKAESEQEVKLSSFDINAVCYDIDPSSYNTLPFYGLVPILYKQLKRICESDSYADNIVSVDGREHIFKFDSVKKGNLRLLLSEVESIFLDLSNNNLLVA